MSNHPNHQPYITCAAGRYIAGAARVTCEGGCRCRPQLLDAVNRDANTSVTHGRERGSCLFAGATPSWNYGLREDCLNLEPGIYHNHGVFACFHLTHSDL